MDKKMNVVKGRDDRLRTLSHWSFFSFFLLRRFLWGQPSHEEPAGNPSQEPDPAGPRLTRPGRAVDRLRQPQSSCPATRGLSARAGPGPYPSTAQLSSPSFLGSDRAVGSGKKQGSGLAGVGGRGAQLPPLARPPAAQACQSRSPDIGQDALDDTASSPGPGSSRAAKARCPPRPRLEGQRPTDTEAEVRPAEPRTDNTLSPITAPDSDTS